MRQAVKLLLLPIALFTLFSSFASAADRQGIDIIRLVDKKDVTGAPGREVTILAIELAPGGSSGLHTHPGDEYGIVTEGILMLKSGDADFKPMSVGQTFSVPPNTPMEVWNTSAKPAKFINMLILEKGKPGASPVK